MKSYSTSKSMRQKYDDHHMDDGITLFLRGDFYEAYFDDAKELARMCDLVLTSRPDRDGVRVPLCGVPEYSSSRFVNLLDEMGVRTTLLIPERR